MVDYKKRLKENAEDFDSIVMEMIEYIEILEKQNVKYELL